MQPTRLKRVVLKEEMVAITKNASKAIILNQLIYWTEILNKADQITQKEIEEYTKLGLVDEAEKKHRDLRNGWFWKSGDELSEEVMGIASGKTINRQMNELAEAGFILIGKNPDPKKKWDRTNWYKVDLEFVQTELKKLGYVLDGYAIPEEPKPEKKSDEPAPLPISQNEKCISQNEKSNSQNEKCISQNETTIPEITSEITSKITSEKEKKDNVGQVPTVDAAPAKKKKPAKPSEADYETIIAYLNEKSGKDFSASSKGHQKLINARFAEGFSIEHFKRVIDNKVRSWPRGSENWTKYMRPSTLFNEDKFDGYLNEGGALQHEVNKTHAKRKPIRTKEHPSWYVG